MKATIGLLSLLFISVASLGQQSGVVHGMVYDSAKASPVEYATVSLLDRDSSLISFSMTDASGRFRFDKLKNGDYRLLVTHVGYVNRSRAVSISASSPDVDLGSVTVYDNKGLLDEVSIRAEAPPVTLIGDTVQYNVSSFKTPPNASVEQLLKKLPGVKVERDGTVKAQGENVSRVLVDGKEFFGSDPKVATKNLPADAIDKVQVYDRQSDQAQLTGFDDGNYEKTINLKLKKDKRKGLFGKVSGGAGTDNRYDLRANVNSFKGARQLSGLALANNSNAEGFSMRDILNFTGEMQRMMRNGGGSVNMSNDPTGWLAGQNRNNAINTTGGIGLNYNNLIGTKTDLQSNYFFNRFNPYAENVIQRRYLLPDSQYVYNQNSVSTNVTANQRFGLNALHQFDSSTSLRLTTSLGLQHTKERTSRSYNTIGGSGKIANQGQSQNISDNEGYSLKNDLFFRKRISRRGRTFSALLQTSHNSSEGKGSLLSSNRFFDAPSGFPSLQMLNQEYTTSADIKGYSGRLVYTEPLFRRSLLEFSASGGITTSNASRLTDDFNSLSGKYDLYNASLSNDYISRYNFSQAGMRLRTQQKKYRYTAGLAWQQANLDGDFVAFGKDSSVDRNFENLLPDASFQYNFNRFKSLSLRYSTSTNKPDITQLQPVADNRDPLNIRFGNPALKQEYVHTFQANAAFVNPYKNKSFFLLANARFTNDRIVSADSLGAAGIKYSRPINTSGAVDFTGQATYSFPLKFLRSSIELRTMSLLSRSTQYINSVANTINNRMITPEIRWDLAPVNKLDVSLGASMAFTKTSYSLQRAFNNQYVSQEYSASADWEMPKQFFLSTDLTLTKNSGRAAGFNQSFPIWNASISKQMLKYKRGEIKFSVNDLLNANIGISRNANQNYIEDIRAKTVRRFFMLRFTYSLSKTGLVRDERR